MPEPLIDEAYCAELERECGNDRALLGEYLQMLMDMGGEILAAMAAAAEQGDQEQLRRQAHRLKGGAGNLACVAVVHWCAEREVAGTCCAADLAEGRSLLEASCQRLGQRWGVDLGPEPQH